MNWKLIFSLSLFALAMAFATISIVPGNIEPVFWLPIFIICAYFIAKKSSGKFFLHGFLLGLANCVWITSVHIIFHATYLAHHPEMAPMADMPIKGNIPLNMLITGPIVGAISGLVIGLFCFIAGKLVKKKAAVA